MENNLDNKVEKYRNDDEIDLVDILAVLIKRKWTIIILLILSIVLSIAYVKFHKAKNLPYSTSFNISLPEEYTINNDYMLSKQNSDTTFFIDDLSKKVNQYKINNENINDISINYDNKTEIININISANNLESTIEASKFIYTQYKNFVDKLSTKNKNIFNIAQNSLDQELKQKQAILNMLLNELNSKSQLSKTSKGSLVYVINFLGDDISNTTRIKVLNQEILLNEGKIEISNGSDSLILNDSLISQISNYIKQEIPSRKKRLLPIIVSVFLALFVGIFLAFILEFFSREDVKTRLKEASKK